VRQRRRRHSFAAGTTLSLTRLSQTFSAREGTSFYCLRTAEAIVTRAIILPAPAIVVAFEPDGWTVAGCRRRAVSLDALYDGWSEQLPEYGSGNLRELATLANEDAVIHQQTLRKLLTFRMPPKQRGYRSRYDTPQNSDRCLRCKSLLSTREKNMAKQRKTYSAELRAKIGARSDCWRNQAACPFQFDLWFRTEFIQPVREQPAAQRQHRIHAVPVHRIPACLQRAVTRYLQLPSTAPEPIGKASAR